MSSYAHPPTSASMNPCAPAPECHTSACSSSGETATRSPSLKFKATGGANAAPPPSHYFKFSTLAGRNPNVTVPNVDLSKYFVSRGIAGDSSGCSALSVSRDADTVFRDPSSHYQSSSLGDEVLSQGDKATDVLRLTSHSGGVSVDGDWTCGVSTNPSTRPSSAQKLHDTDAAVCGGPTPLTLASPTALLSSAPEWQSQFYRTKLCPFYVRDIPDQQSASAYGNNVGCAEGDCVNGDACRFAHSMAELRPLPDLRKTKLCSSYTKKVACRNSKCPFAHSPKELRTSSSVFYKVTLCNFYKNGKCWNGANCRFAHGNDELRNASTNAASSLPPVKQNQSATHLTVEATNSSARHRNKGSVGLLPKPAVHGVCGPRAVPPPPPPPNRQLRRPSLSSLSTTDTHTHATAWKAHLSRHGGCHAVHEESIETETAPDENVWFDHDDVPEDPPGFSPMGASLLETETADPNVLSLLDPQNPALIELLAMTLQSMSLDQSAEGKIIGDSMIDGNFQSPSRDFQSPSRDFSSPSHEGLQAPLTRTLQAAPTEAFSTSSPVLTNRAYECDDNELACLQMLLKIVNGQLDR